MSQQHIRIISGKEIKEYPESQRKDLIRFYNQGAKACDGSESERYAYIADSLSMGAIEIDSYKQASVFPKGSEGALLEEGLKNISFLFD